jgi:uncharacterized membrane protein YkoI
MKSSSRCWQLVCLLALTAGLLIAIPGSATAQDGGGKGKQKGKMADVVEVDLSKLPPELAQKVRDALKGQGKAITLIEAIKIVQATGKGEVERAERRVKNGVTVFYVTVSTGERQYTRFTLDAQGKITDTKKADAD